MNSIDVRNFGRAGHGRNIQIALRQLRRPDADRLVGKAHVQRVPVGLAINGNRANAQLLARTNHAQGDLTAIGNQNLVEHAIQPSALSRQLSLLPFVVDWLTEAKRLTENKKARIESRPNRKSKTHFFGLMTNSS